LKLKFTFDFPPSQCNDLLKSSLNLLDNQLRFLDGLEHLSEKLPLADSLEANRDEYKPYIVHSWLLNIPDLGKMLRLQAATPRLWTTNNAPKSKYLYGNYYINYIESL